MFAFSIPLWLLLRLLLLRWLFLGWLLLTFNLNKTFFGETGCLGNPYFLLTGCLGIQFFNSPPFSLWLPTPHCAAPMWLRGRYTMSLVTRCFPPNPYPGKQRISLEVTSILSMCLCSHTKFASHQKGYIW